MTKAIEVKPGKQPHIGWIDLKGDGIWSECAIMKIDPMGNVHFFEVGKLDRIDKQRLSKIIRHRNARSFELWDLMAQITLNNGVNALEYFHQLVKVVSGQRKIYNPRSGKIGTGVVDIKTPEQRQHEQDSKDLVKKAAEAAANIALNNDK